MDEQQNSWMSRWSPSRLADEANDEFVRLARLLARFLTWEACARQGQAMGDSDSGSERPTVARSAGGGSCARRRRGCALDADGWEALAERVDRIVNHTATMPTGGWRQTRGVADSAMDDGTHGLKLRELFDRDAARRLSAVQWIRRGGFSEAVPLLEGVLVIEESPEVREAIDSALHELKAGHRVDVETTEKE